ncbi:MAG: hypothetical protein Q9157_000480 [Trypethelium eluteriae]
MANLPGSEIFKNIDPSFICQYPQIEKVFKVLGKSLNVAVCSFMTLLMADITVVDPVSEQRPCGNAVLRKRNRILGRSFGKITGQKDFESVASKEAGLSIMWEGTKVIAYKRVLAELRSAAIGICLIERGR